MQEFELLLIAAIGLSTLAMLVATRASPRVRRSGSLRILLGVIPGLLGAVIVLVPNSDLVPDDFEHLAVPVIVVLVSIVALVGGSYRLLQHR